MSLYHVDPPEAGIYFNKIQCFCFEEQLLNARERRVLSTAFPEETTASRERVWPVCLQKKKSTCLCSSSLTPTFSKTRASVSAFHCPSKKTSELPREVEAACACGVLTEQMRNITLSYVFFESESEIPDEYKHLTAGLKCHSTLPFRRDRVDD